MVVAGTSFTVGSGTGVPGGSPRKMKELGEPAWIMVQIQRKRDIVDESVVMCSFSCDYNYDI